MAFFPFRRNRMEADAFFDQARILITETGLGFYALERKEDGATIGYCSLVRTDLEPHISVGSVEIGWRLARRYWGQAYASEAARTLLSYGFETLNLEEIVSFAVHNNERSAAVMKRIGMRHEADRDFDHPRVPDTMPHLKRHVLYRLTRQQWRADVTARH